MPAVRRLVLNLLTTGSLVLCVASGALWVRSYWVWEALNVYDERGDGTLWVSTVWSLLCRDGRLSWDMSQHTDTDPAAIARYGVPNRGRRWFFPRNEASHDSAGWWQRHRFEALWQHDHTLPPRPTTPFMGANRRPVLGDRAGPRHRTVATLAPLPPARPSAERHVVYEVRLRPPRHAGAVPGMRW